MTLAPAFSSSGSLGKGLRVGATTSYGSAQAQQEGSLWLRA